MITVGMDEVGRGCWAGPMVAGAVLLTVPIEGLRDSKQLSPKRREVLASQILESAVASLGWVSPDEIDSLGLTDALSLAMARALAGIEAEYDEVVIDGNYNFLAGKPSVRTLIKADATVPAVSAASIVAKVARDRYMAEQSLAYPDYGFEKHVGYGTKQHLNALQKYGVTPLHRLSYRPVRATMQP